MVSASGARAIARCDELGVAPYSDAPDGLFRAFLTPAHGAALGALGGWMADAGMCVELDPAANLVGRYEGTVLDAPALLIGSHIDSVRDAGRYDGPLGIMLGIECVAALNGQGRRLPFAIEVIAFGDEEGSRFPASMFCSRAVAGTLEAGALGVADRDGVTLVEALSAFTIQAPPLQGRGWGGALVSHPNDVGSDCAGLPHPNPSPEGEGLTGFISAARKPGSILAFLEAHIEQGPLLEAEGLALGLVTGIAAQLRFQVTIKGKAGHAGTNAMHLRRDALTGAAEAVLAIERIGREGGDDLVATVGRMTVGPGAVNVVPGRVDFSIDVRSGDETVRDKVAARIVEAIEAIAAARELSIICEQVQDLAASPCDPGLTDLLGEAMVATGHPARRLVSGAGHDSMVMAALCPTAMLFIRCKEGISHNPAESATAEDAEAALQVMLAFIDKLGVAYLV